jgi:CheY-like chemotaxis protein
VLSDHHAIYEAEDGMVALRLASMIPNLSLVISEVSLPTFGGVDLVKVFKAHDALRHIPFVFLTGGASPNDVHRLISAGARVCLDKSLAPKQILRLVGELTAR